MAKKDDNSDASLLAIAKERYKAGLNGDSHNRTRFIDDLKFLNGDTVWSEARRKQRETDGQPCFVIDCANPALRQVVNDQRQNPISVKVRPADNDADIETAEVFQGVIRNVESVSNAEIAYENAFYYAAAGGFGYFRIITDYIEGTFEQDAIIKPIHNALSVVRDPKGRQPDGSDWDWCFLSEDLKKEEFKASYGEYEDVAKWEDDLQKQDEWCTKDTVRVAEYFYYDYQKDTLYLMPDGRVLNSKEYKEAKEPAFEDSRETTVKKVKWCLLAGDKILEKRDWAGKYLPVIPMYGDMIEIEGKLHTIGLIHRGKDSARMLSFFRSTETELLALQPKAPIVGAEGQFEGHPEWDNANTVSYSKLEYKPTTFNGQLLPPPQRQGFAAPPSGVMQGAINAEHDFMRSTGIYEAGLGQKSNETSGKAILARQKEGDNSTFHFTANKALSVQRCGTILVDLLPKLYDTKRVIRILGEDGTEDMKELNTPVQEKDKQGNPIERIYDLSVGKYDVVASSGASYQTRRQEAAEGMVAMMQANPAMAATHGDIVAEAMDWPDAEAFAKRSKKVISMQMPGIIEPEGEDEAPQIPPELQMQLEQQGQMVEQMKGHIAELSNELEDKSAKEQEMLIKAEAMRLAEENKGKELDLKAKELEHKIFKEDLTDSEKANLDASVKIKTSEDNLDHAEEMALFNKRHELNSKDEMVEHDENMQPKASPLAQHMASITEGMAKTQEDLQALITVMAAPKEVLRDASGKAIGIKPVL